MHLCRAVAGAWSGPKKLHVLQSLHSTLRPLPVWLQELGLACMDSDPEARPNFQKVLEMLDRVPC